MAHLKRSIVEVKAEENCFAHALIIAIARVDNDANYKPYRQGRKIRPVVQTLLQETGINLTRGKGVPELKHFQENFRDYNIIVYQGVGCDDIMFEGQVDPFTRLNLLYDDVERHYHVIAKLTGAVAKSSYVRRATKRVKVTSHTSATRRVANVMRGPHARSPTFVSPATIVTDILGVGHISLTTSLAPQREIPDVNLNDVAQRAEHS